MKKSRIISALLGLLAVPINLYLFYWIISQLEADRLIWFLFIIYVPLIIIVVIMQKLVEDE